MSQCAEPGCTGTIDGGYCVLCGVAASSSPAPPAPDACAQPGCAGKISDGYCDVCGNPPASVPSVPAPRPPVAVPDDSCPLPGCAGTIMDGYCDVCGAPPAHTTLTSRAEASVHSGSTGTGSSVRTGSARTGSARSSGRRGMLGAGLVEVPRVPYRDPSTAVMSDPQVAEGKRFCSNCDHPVGRGRGGQPGRTEGFCPKCGARFSFTPKLRPGDLLGGQYDVLGCLAHGGLGWIYLAKDRNVSDRWVVLKGLLDSGDADASAAAAAERAFLAEVEHPNIVKIYNFVQHEGDGYIVMEYVGGRSLKDILLQQPQPAGEKHLPLAQAIAYGLEVLRAFEYLHAQGLVYCDFKPDNVIQSEEQLRLIDLGGVRRLDDPSGAIYGTVGYQAPEIADAGPSISSDLYTVGRSLAVLSFPFRGFTRTFSTSLPSRSDVPVLQRFESFDRFLRRATHPDPARRFQDAAEMAEQLTGVLREVLAAEDGRPRPAPSGLFGPERFTTRMAGGESDASALPPVPPEVAAAALPVPLADGSDPAAAFVSGLSALEPEQVVEAVKNAPERTPEVRLTLARVKIELGAADEATELLDELTAERPDDWRVDWYRAVGLLARGRTAEAEPWFDRLYGLLPGEAAPKLALAYCREHTAPRDAVRLYDMVWRTDQSYINAAFGLARVHLAAGDRRAAVAALDSVPKISIQYLPAQVAAIATVVRGRNPAELTAAELVGAGDRLTALDLDAERRDRLAAEVLEAALDWLLDGPGTAAGTRGGSVLGTPFAEPKLRRLLESTYRELARRTRDREECRRLVDSANAVRPRTLL
ncbi:serine/threonine protein kinase [Actinomadura spongiicola]|uniref:non-specific serine/threonine protein kinase n=1 Tax=Actinomadura spongiicola TaxID=2303421 RepID=A0A372GK30_9ACTN|nr:serine/threonine-protein kinase [Actinomadura spongiicola]RFS85721.1 serine/threonine protein kinase [Actinomadura spongiicola]